ncbi:MAG: hypothetical protein HY764_04015 [Candidatus Portnoybacteria bacterium]|nr:hypothetical protein [Candidatus Portnoybacteria bacterium]
MDLAFREKVNNLPEPVKNVLLSDLPTQTVHGVGTSYGIALDGRGKIAKLIGLVFVNDAPLEKMPEIFQRELPAPMEIANGLSCALAKTIFLPLKQYFPNIESLIQNWSRTATPPTHKAELLELEENNSAPIQNETPKPAPQEIANQTIASAINQKPEIANQKITESPIRLPDSESPRLPSIGNWLTDYAKFRTGFPEQDLALVRMRYIYESQNGRALKEQERVALNQVLKSFDEQIELPFSKETGLLILEKPMPSAPAPKSAPAQPIPQPQPPRGVPISGLPQKPTYQPPPSSIPTKDAYKEPVSSEDLSGPVLQAPKPTPKLEGNIVNLRKDFNQQ